MKPIFSSKNLSAYEASYGLRVESKAPGPYENGVAHLALSWPLFAELVRQLAEKKRIWEVIPKDYVRGGKDVPSVHADIRSTLDWRILAFPFFRYEDELWVQVNHSEDPEEALDTCVRRAKNYARRPLPDSMPHGLIQFRADEIPALEAFLVAYRERAS